ncbi:pyridoxamine 5'-phosphate oxidase family protein [Candidatus Saccharibacteria bacterium]|nr:pyridoxamine 5'-phosphate oxidase family protein [Candidatus Saccharibacteria bacterium]
MPKPTVKHTERIHKALIDAGLSPIAMLKAESRYLPHVIHTDEKIGGVVNGWYENGSAMLVATDRRIIFLDKKPIYTTKEEVTYDVVAGVRLDIGGVSTVLTLHTRIRDFKLKYVNPASAKRFVRYIEKQQLEVAGGRRQQPVVSVDNREVLNTPVEAFPFLTYEAKSFLDTNSIAVLSTKDNKGKVSGAVVYYIVDQLDRVYILTKEGTNKAKNMTRNSQVALTIFDQINLRTLQIDGIASIEKDQKTIGYVFSEITKPRRDTKTESVAPVVNIDKGDFIVFRITIKGGDFSDFGANKLSKSTIKESN